MTAATLPSLPAHLLPSFSKWRQSIYHSPLSSPMTSAVHHQKLQFHPHPPTLPPISFLDRHLSAMPPLTPPRLEFPQNSSSPNTPMLPTPAFQPNPFDYHNPPPRPSPERASHPFEDVPYLVDWLDFTRKRSAHSIAEKTCEMICYLWFSSPSSHCTQPGSATTSLQLLASPTFVQFMQKVLETTQVSQSVIVLSLHYIYRLKERNRFTSGQAGSEFRIAVAGLMMANKFLDDNTYTNKTWSEVSGIDLAEINRMEREFLMGIDFSLYVDKPTYESWLNLLKGLIMAKEKDSKRWRRSRVLPRASRLYPNSSRSFAPSRYPTSHRARSTSPSSSDPPRGSYNSHPTYPISHPANPESSPRSGVKRSAADAFSPTSASFAQIPSKRPVSMSLIIPENLPISGPNPSSQSPLEPLHSFAQMSLGSSPAVRAPSTRAPPVLFPSTVLDNPSATLAAAYAVDEQRRPVVPQNLYFYSLACSPMEKQEQNDNRKARLRYHQPPLTTLSYYPPKPSIPMDIQSASTSPHDVHMNLPPPLPPFYASVWSRQYVSSNALPSCDFSPPPHLLQAQQHVAEFSECSVPSAPFANAGPPGVQFYTTPTSFQRSFAAYASSWTRGRPF